MSGSPLQLRGGSVTVDTPQGDRRTLLDGIDLELAAGERVGLVGPSGAGKTTLALVLAGLLPLARGTVESPPPLTPGPAVGLVFQNAERSFFAETVLDDVAFGPHNSGLSDSEAHERARLALRRVGLDPQTIGPQPPETLSGGEARRVAIAAVLALEPQVVIFDEPTVGLDRSGRERLGEILDALHAGGVATVLISHEPAFLAPHCDRALVMQEGKIVWDGPMENLREGVPDEWREEPADWGLELWELRQALSTKGWIDAEVAPTPVSLARAVARAAKDPHGELGGEGASKL